MPQFSPGESKVALATFTVKPAGLSCGGELWLALNGSKVATSGEVPFVSTGTDQSITLPVTMPSAEGTYPVYLDVFVAGQLIGAYRAIEDVVISLPVVAFVYSNQQCGTIHCPTAPVWGCPTYSCTITNPGSSRVTRTITFIIEDWDTYSKEWRRGWKESFQLTLDPGQSYNWVFDNTGIPPAEIKFCYGADSIIYMHLEDDAGGESAKCTTKRYW